MLKTNSDKEIFIALDANAIVHRAFHAFPPNLITSSGLQVNAAYGFTSMFLKILEMYDPKYLVCAFDTGKPTFRHAKFSDYKGTRKPTDQSLIDQFPVVESIVSAFNVPIVKKDGYEADDVLGTFAKWVTDGKWADRNIHLYIVSGDRDLFQLVNENVSVILPEGSFKNLKVFDKNGVHEKLGIFPGQVVDYKALVGDASDNIPGVRGLGPKTVVGLLEEYGTLENIFMNLPNLKPRTQNLLQEASEQAAFSRELALICQDVPVHISLEECLERDFNSEVVRSKFVELEFRTLVSKIPESLDDRKNKEMQQTEQMGLFGSMSDVGSLSYSNNADFLAILSEATRLYLMFVNADEGDSVFLGVKTVDKSGKDSVFKFSLGDLSQEIVSHLVGKISGRETLSYGVEDFISSVWKYLSTDPFPLTYDIKLLGHLESSERRNDSFSNLSFDYISKPFSEKLYSSDLGKYLQALEDISKKIFPLLKGREIDSAILSDGFECKDFLSFSARTELDLAVALAAMENRGVYIDNVKLHDLHVYLDAEIKKLVEEIYYDVGHEFNINSSRQLADVLFNELGLPVMGRAKTMMSTREEVLRALQGAHPVVSKILDYRQKTKIMSTYIQVYSDIAEKCIKEGQAPCIYTNFKQTGASSGRLSSVNPNMQNLPIGNELSSLLREIFIPRDGYVLVSADYSQIDLRVMAHLSEDVNLINDFKSGKDIHTSTASRILNKNIEDISSSERSVGKTINFGIIYGLTSFGLSDRLKISVEDADKYIKEYFAEYHGIAGYINHMTKEVQNIGYVQTMLGRRRVVPGVNSKNIRIKRAAIREAINMPVQGGSADIMKLAMIALHKKILEKYMSTAYLVLQIHDEIIFEVKEESLEEFEKDVKNIMTKIVNIKVPLDVHISHGKNMAELK